MLLQHLLEVSARMAGGMLCHRLRSAHHHDLASQPLNGRNGCLAADGVVAEEVHLGTLNQMQQQWYGRPVAAPAVVRRCGLRALTGW